MRKNIRKVVLSGILGIFCISLTACSNNKTETGLKEIETTVSTGNKYESVAESDEKTVELPEGKKVITDCSEFVAPTESQEYNFDTDYQFYMQQSLCGVKTRNGYVINQERMHLFDTEQKTYTYMCLRPQCLHISTKCDAYAPTWNGCGYQNGSIYTVFCDNSNDYAEFDIVKVSEDDQTKETVQTVVKVEKESEETLENCGMDYIFHRGYIYYIYSIGVGPDESEFYNNYSNCLYRMPLDGSGEPEFIMAMDTGFYLGLENMMAYGSYVYFCMCDLNGYGEIYRYNTESDQIEKMDIGVIAEETYTVLDGCIVYKKNYYETILYKYNPMDGTESVFADITEVALGDSWNVNRDNNYVFVYHTNDDTKEAYFIYLHHDGTYAGKMVVNTSYSEHIWYGDVIGGDEYFIYKLTETGEIMYAEKAQLENGETVYLTKANQQ